MSVETEEEAISRKEAKRSAAYPFISLESAIAFTTEINNHFSSTVAVTREEVAKELGISGISRQLAACTSFGLLTKTSNGKDLNTYQVTELFTSILRYENEKQKKIDIIKSLGKPKLYQELIKKFDGNNIPLELPNTLIRHHDIAEAASKGAAEIFIASCKFAGVLNDNRVLQYGVTLSTLEKTKSFNNIEEAEEVVEDQREDKETNSLVRVNSSDFVDINEPDKRIPIYLTNKKVGWVVYPDDLSENDIKIFQSQLGVVLLRLQLENDEKKAAVAAQ